MDMTLAYAIAAAHLVAAGGYLAWRNRYSIRHALFDIESRMNSRANESGAVIQALDVAPGSAVADIGSGKGTYSLGIANAVSPGGVVYAVDVDPSLLDYVWVKGRRQGLTNIETVVGRGDDPLLPVRVDLVFMRHSFHHIADRPSYLHTLKSYLKQGGSIAIIDFRKSWPPFHRRLRYTADDLKLWARQAGLRVERELAWESDRFLAVLREG
jgi:ubiquinone/menaquinone biosynthesis C-methylase UbiE